jgi:hypothetical protein
MVPSTYVPTGLATYLVVTWILRAAQKGKVKGKEGVLFFDCLFFLRVLLMVLIFGFAAGSFYTAFFLKDVWFSILCACLSLGVTIAFPSPISLDETKIQINRWYAPPKAIHWADVTRLEYHRGPMTTVVVSKSGSKIAHTAMHSDSPVFQSECQRRAGIKMKTTQL